MKKTNLLERETNLFITVIGENSLNRDLQNICEILVRLAQLTGAWIIADGLQNQVTNSIGLAISQNSYYKYKSNINVIADPIVLLGVNQNENQNQLNPKLTHFILFNDENSTFEYSTRVAKEIKNHFNIFVYFDKENFISSFEKTSLLLDNNKCILILVCVSIHCLYF